MMRKKNVLYVGGFELPDKNAAAHRVMANGKILKSLEYNVFYMGVSNDRECATKVMETEESKNYGIDYKIKYPQNKLEWFNYLSSISDIIRIVEKNSIDIVIAYNYPALSLYKLNNYCKKHKIKLFADCTEWEIANGGIIFRILKGMDSYFRMRIVHPKLNGIITISRFLHNFYIKKNSNVILVPPLIDLEDFKWNLKSIQKKNTELRTIIYAGKPGPNKDHLGRLIEALSILKKKSKYDFLLEIIGITKDEYNLIWKNFIIPDEVSENIKFYGRVSNLEVINMLKEADYSIFIREPNLKNIAGFPTKYVESITSGTPVLTNKLSDIEEYLEDGLNGFYLDISSIEDISASIEKAISVNRVEIDEMKDNCRKYRGFNYKEYSHLFENLLK